MESILVFISSPSDVAEERFIARGVAERLQGEFSGRLKLDTFFWEHEPLLATDDFQTQIDDCRQRLRQHVNNIDDRLVVARLQTFPDNFTNARLKRRDPRVNEDPDGFDIRREEPKQISFGYGIHLCLGASLARLEARVAFEELLGRYPDLSLVDEQPRWGDNAFLRGLEVLKVSTQKPDQVISG